MSLSYITTARHHAVFGSSVFARAARRPGPDRAAGNPRRRPVLQPAQQLRPRSGDGRVGGGPLGLDGPAAEGLWGLVGWKLSAGRRLCARRADAKETQWCLMITISAHVTGVSDGPCWLMMAILHSLFSSTGLQLWFVFASPWTKNRSPFLHGFSIEYWDGDPAVTSALLMWN